MKNGVFYFGISSLVLEIIIQLLVKKLMTSQTVHDYYKSQNWEHLRKYWMGVVQTWQWLSRSSIAINNILYAVTMTTFYCLLLGPFNAGFILSFISVTRHLLVSWYRDVWKASWAARFKSGHLLLLICSKPQVFCLMQTGTGKKSVDMATS